MAAENEDWLRLSSSSYSDVPPMGLNTRGSLVDSLYLRPKKSNVSSATTPGQEVAAKMVFNILMGRSIPGGGGCQAAGTSLTEGPGKRGLIDWGSLSRSQGGATYAAEGLASVAEILAKLPCSPVRDRWNRPSLVCNAEEGSEPILAHLASLLYQEGISPHLSLTYLLPLDEKKEGGSPPSSSSSSSFLHEVAVLPQLVREECPEGNLFALPSYIQALSLRSLPKGSAELTKEVRLGVTEILIQLTHTVALLQQRYGMVLYNLGPASLMLTSPCRTGPEPKNHFRGRSLLRQDTQVFEYRWPAPPGKGKSPTRSLFLPNRGYLVKVDSYALACAYQIDLQLPGSQKATKVSVMPCEAYPAYQDLVASSLDPGEALLNFPPELLATAQEEAEALKREQIALGVVRGMGLEAHAGYDLQHLSYQLAGWLNQWLIMEQDLVSIPTFTETLLDAYLSTGGYYPNNRSGSAVVAPAQGYIWDPKKTSPLDLLNLVWEAANNPEFNLRFCPSVDLSIYASAGEDQTPPLVIQLGC